MVKTGAGANNIFRQVEKIQLAYIPHQSHVYFGLLGLGNIGNNVLPNPLVVSDILKLSGST